MKKISVLIFCVLTFPLFFSCKNEKDIIVSETKPTWIVQFDFDKKNNILTNIAINSYNELYIGGNGGRLKKLDKNGTVLINDLNTTSQKPFIKDIYIDSQTNVFFCGWSRNLFSEESGSDGILKKFDYKKGIDSKTSSIIIDFDNSTESLSSICVDENQHVYVGGYTYNSINEKSKSDWFIMKADIVDNQIETIWQKNFDARNKYDNVEKIIIHENNLYAIGTGQNIISEKSNDDWWIKKFDLEGNEDTTNWNKMYDANNGDDGPKDCAIDSEGNLYIVGYKTIFTDEGNFSGTNWWLKKIDKNGNEDIKNWNKSFSSYKNSIDKANAIVIDKNDNVYIGGDTQISTAATYQTKIDLKFTIWNHTPPPHQAGLCAIFPLSIGTCS